MKILLVNSNPVVSRLTALSARKESVELDEIKEISELKKSDYNIVFVDSEAYSPKLSNILKNSDIKRKVLFYTQDDKDRDEIFNFTILKPFLPSEVSAILREAKMEIDEEDSKLTSTIRREPQEENLDFSELISTKKDDLTPLMPIEEKPKEIKVKEKRTPIELEGKEEELLKELAISKKVKVKKQDEFIIKEEKKTEENFDTNELFELDSIQLDEIKEVKENTKENKKDSKREIKKENLLFVEDKKENDMKIKDEVLIEDKEGRNEIDFKKETKILDKEEIFNIKTLLNDDAVTENKLSLTDVMTTSPATSLPSSSSSSPSTESKIDEKKIAKKKKKKRVKNIKQVEVENRGGKEVIRKVFSETVGSLPIEELRQLLRGTKIHITIEFPKEV
jgi:hypothetical protein